MAEDCIINKLSWNISHYPNAASYIQPAFDDGDENDVHFVALPDEDWETIVFQEETVIKVLQLKHFFKSLNSFLIHFPTCQVNTVLHNSTVVNIVRKCIHTCAKFIVQ